MILGLETSCDDTSVALLTAEGVVRAMRAAHQDDRHRPFGGVVPEVASRSHTEVILPLIDALLSEAGVTWPEISGIAVTSRPGLIGSLLVGVVTAKTLSLVNDLPLIGVNHIEGHLLAPLLRDQTYAPPEGFDFPYLGLAVSGGHTHLFICHRAGRYELLGQTRDDAAGEAFDKFAKRLGLGFPGGINVDRLARGANPKAFAFPRGFRGEKHLDFTFSGLKSAGLRQIEALGPDVASHEADLCASFQEAIVDVLVANLRRATERTGLKRWAITGGVSANSRLRAVAGTEADKLGVTLAMPPLRYCTDNAAMIALAGLYRLRAGETSGHELSPVAHALSEDWRR